MNAPLEGRLGLNVPSGWWPTPSMVKAFEAAGFGWIQVHSPPRPVLCEPALARDHALALRRVIDATGLRLVLHGPDELSAGRPDHDRALAGLIDYAARVRAERVVYHGANFRLAHDNAAAEALRRRVLAEERSLRGVLGTLESAGVILAIENLAPVFPSPARLCHSPRAISALVRRLGSPNVGMLFDVGHANVVAGLTKTSTTGALDAVAGDVVLFHVHDNLGARREGEEAPGVDPLRLDLHLAPGAGTSPWPELAQRLTSASAPLVLEVHPPHRSSPVEMARAACTALNARSLAPAA